jgi:tartrate-resistant acid phosphatase type 5
MPVKNQRFTDLVYIGMLCLMLTACAAASTPVPLPATRTPVPPTETFGPAVTETSFPTETETATQLPVPTDTPQPVGVRFAVIGDFGEGNQAEADVAALVHGWKPDIIITVGDDNYPSGAADTIDAHIGQYYHDYIYPYTGTYGPGAAENRFFPTLGNHDWYSDAAKPYFDYFTLPGNERYYEFTRGPVHFFALDSDSSEPDGVGKTSVQAAWFKQAIAVSTSRWNVVFFHHAPYTSGMHGNTNWMQWPFAAWGADAVLSGHDHTYERLQVDGIPYFVNGLGGGPIYAFPIIVPESQFRYDDNYGAMLVTATTTEMNFEFYNRKGELIDSYKLTKP